MIVFIKLQYLDAYSKLGRVSGKAIDISREFRSYYCLMKIGEREICHDADIFFVNVTV